MLTISECEGGKMKKIAIMAVTLLTTTSLLVACGSHVTKKTNTSSEKTSKSVNHKKKSSKKDSSQSSVKEIVSQSSVVESESQSQSQSSSSEKPVHYSIVGSWEGKQESGSKITFNEDGTFEKYSATAGFKTSGTYRVVNQEGNTMVVHIAIKYPNGQTHEQDTQYQFTNEKTLIEGNQQYIRNN